MGDGTIRFEIVEQIGVITENPATGWRKELNLVSWNGGAAKYDIREWNPTHEHMSKGLTFTEQEMKLICSLFKDR